MNIWFTADNHFGHDNIIQHCKRNFKSVREMDETMIENWNKVVKKGDTVYHLGDFAWVNVETYRKRLMGDIHLIRGNHDRWSITKYSKLFNSVCDLKHLNLLKEKNVYIVLFHYAMRTWHRSHYGSIHLFGHSHGMMPDWGLSTDIGVDVWNYTPVNLDVIIEKMRTKNCT